MAEQNPTQSLGVSAASLQALGATRNDSAWTFPERDAEGRIIGTARRFDDGRKLMVTGSKRGLTMAWPLPAYAGTSPNDPILVVEGASDTAAGMQLGFVTIGRPSATGGLEYLRVLLRDRHVVVVGENDDSGRRGAEKIAEGLIGWAESVKIIYPPDGAKDLRHWKVAPAGCDRDEILAAIRAANKCAVQGRASQSVPALPWRPFPIDALPKPVRSFVSVGSKAIDCDPSYIALPVLAALASTIGNTRCIQLKRGWTEPAILWTATVGESGTLKTPAFRRVMRPLREIQSKAMREHQEMAKRYERELLEYEKELAAWKRDKDTTNDPPTKPDPPATARLVVSDTTVEALAPLLQDNWRGLLLARDELAGWITSFDRYARGRGGDSAHWLSMHVGESMIVDRKTGDRLTMLIPRAAVSVTGCIQPGILHRVLGTEHRESGLAARLLLAWPPRRNRKWTEADFPPELEARFASLLDRLLELNPNTYGDDEMEPVIVPLLPEAKATWIEFYNAHAREQSELTGDLSAVWSKLEGYAARLALVIHFVRWATDDPTLVDPDAIDEMSIAAGVALSRWFGHEARRVYVMLTESDEDRERRWLIELIDRKSGRITPNELRRSSRQFRDSADEGEQALNELVKARLGHWEQSDHRDQGGRPARTFVLSTVSTVYETPQNSGQNRGFVDVDSEDAAKTEREEIEL